MSNQSFLNKIATFLLIAGLITSCGSNQSRGDYSHTSILCEGLYLEVFRIYGSGAFGGDKMRQYLTDSIRFRICVGEFDNAIEHYSYVCKGEDIEILKCETSNGGASFNIIKTQTYNIRELETFHDANLKASQNKIAKCLFE